MILGTGIDLVEVARIRASVERFGERFLARLFAAGELVYCRQHRDPAPFLAARFAAKEAVSKAFGTGIGARLGWLDIEVARHESGQPYVILHGKGLVLLSEKGGGTLHLSLSHTETHATAVAVLERLAAGAAAAARSS